MISALKKLGIELRGYMKSLENICRSAGLTDQHLTGTKDIVGP